MEPQSSSKSIVWIIIIVVILALGTYFFFGRIGNNQSAPQTTFPGQTTLINSIEVKDQLADTSAIISDLTLDKGGFVVIQTSSNDQPGTIIGFQYFDRGERPAKVALSTPTKSGETYFATLYSDDGDLKFDPTKDVPLKDAAGNVLSRSFKAVESLPEVKG